jgi:hypothetical protein
MNKDGYKLSLQLFINLISKDEFIPSFFLGSTFFIPLSQKVYKVGNTDIEQ